MRRGAPILSGRGFHADDPGSLAPVVIVNRAFVDRVLGGRNAIGRRVEPTDKSCGRASRPAYRSVNGACIPSSVRRICMNRNESSRLGDLQSEGNLGNERNRSSERGRSGEIVRNRSSEDSMERSSESSDRSSSDRISGERSSSDEWSSGDEWSSSDSDSSASRSGGSSR